jgi:hypothetical protein
MRMMAQPTPSRIIEDPVRIGKIIRVAPSRRVPPSLLLRRLSAVEELDSNWEIFLIFTGNNSARLGWAPFGKAGTFQRERAS